MNAAKKAVVLSVLLGALGGSAVTAGAAVVLSEDHTASVDSHMPTETREDHIRDWEKALARSGKSLPPTKKLDAMSDREIFEAMWDENRNYVEPMDMPNEVVD